MDVPRLLRSLARSSSKPEWYHVLTCLEEPKTTQELLDCCRARGASGKYAMLDLHLARQLGLVRFSYDGYVWILTRAGREFLDGLRRLEREAGRAAERS